MSENLFQEFSDFEAKYVIHDDGKPLMNLEELEKENFEIISFISENFLLNKENSLINYVKLQEAFQIMHELQGKTLEEIAISVDLNLDRYMEVSKQFEQIKAPLIQINETFSQLKALLNDYKFGCQSSSKDLNELIGNKEILEIYEAEFVKLKEIRKEFIIIEEFLNNPSNFAFIFISRIFQKIFENLEALNHRIGDKVHILIEKYQLKELVQHHRKTFLKLIEGKMKELLSQIINPNQEINKEMKDDFMRFLNSYELLKESKKDVNFYMKAEDLVKENLIKPFLESLLNSVLVLPSKSGVTITATKKEFIEKNLSNKIILFRNLFEGIIAFMKGAFSFFISLKEYNITGDLIYYGSSYNYVELLFSSVMKSLNSKEISFIYSVGVADSFYQNYIIAEELVEEFSFVYKGIQSKKFLQEIENFKSKWNLSTYFYLRNNEILKSFEKSFKATINGIFDKIDKGMLSVIVGTFPLSVCLHENVKNCFKKGIILKPLISNFLRLSLQIISRFCILLESHVKLLNIDENTFNQEKICFLSNETVNIIESLWLGKFNFQTILTSDMNKSLITLTEKKLNLTLISLLSPIIEKYSKGSLDNLEPFNGIPAKFRMNLSSINVQKPSNFIGNVFKPLQNFIFMNLLIDKANSIVKKQVLDRVFKTFQNLIQDILKTSQKSEELMTKFINQDKNIESELEKIKLQFKLDFMEMKRLAENKFGYNISIFICELD